MIISVHDKGLEKKQNRETDRKWLGRVGCFKEEGQRRSFCEADSYVIGAWACKDLGESVFQAERHLGHCSAEGRERSGRQGAQEGITDKTA